MTVHIACHQEYFADYQATPGATLNSAGSTAVLGRGTVKIFVDADGQCKTIVLKDVVHAPGIPHNLISLGQLEAGGNKIKIEEGKLAAKDKKGCTFLCSS